jgi:hypothetical protein
MAAKARTESSAELRFQVALRFSVGGVSKRRVILICTSIDGFAPSAEWSV